jgi:hypothetical protein
MQLFPHAAFRERLLFYGAKHYSQQLRKLDELQDDIERWTYFLQHGDELDAEHLPAPLAIPEIRQAAGVLTMLSHNDVET